MLHLSIISSSIREGRKSHRVALYLKNELQKNSKIKVDIIDLEKENFPFFKERLKHQIKPLKKAINFSSNIKTADGIIIVSPEYNGGYPASLKNVIDLLYEEWKHKPIAFSTVSDGPFAGSQSLVSLQFTFWKIGALMVAASFPVANVSNNFEENGNCLYPEEFLKRFKHFSKELLYSIEIGASKKLT